MYQLFQKNGQKWVRCKNERNLETKFYIIYFSFFPKSSKTNVLKLKNRFVYKKALKHILQKNSSMNPIT